jgi:hypothetical protein
VVPISNRHFPALTSSRAQSGALVPLGRSGQISSRQHRRTIGPKRSKGALSLVLDAKDAMIAARTAIFDSAGDHERKIGGACLRWQGFNSEHRARGKGWMQGTGDMPIPNMASEPLPDYLCAALKRGCLSIDLANK